jgi:hypothetical protein
MRFAAGYLRFAFTHIEPNLRFAFTRHDANYRLLTLRVQIGKQSGIILMSIATHHPSPYLIIIISFDCFDRNNPRRRASTNKDSKGSNGHYLTMF